MIIILKDSITKIILNFAKFVSVSTGLEIGGVALQNANYFRGSLSLIANHFGKVNRKTANHF